MDAGRDEFLAPRVRAVADALAGKRERTTDMIPLDLIGTAFQKRVWDALMKIPTGETRSYAELAASLDAPKATRAVASACSPAELNSRRRACSFVRAIAALMLMIRKITPNTLAPTRKTTPETPKKNGARLTGTSIIV